MTRMRKASLITGVLIVIIGLIFALTRNVQGGKRAEADIYLALGDGLPLGIDDKGLVGASYVDYLGTQLQSANTIKRYYKDYTRYNLRSFELLRLIERDAIGIVDGQSVRVSQLITSAKLISIQVGMHDFINYIHYSPTTRTVEYDTERIFAALELVQINIFQVVEELYLLNPGCRIVLLGYYSFFPWCDPSQRHQVKELFDEINAVFAEISYDCEIDFIDISVVGDQQYLPSLISPFPGPDGYKRIASIIKENID